MQYEQMVRQAWQMAWQHRYLWLFGIFSGGATGIGFTSPPSTGDWSQMERDLNVPLSEIDGAIAQGLAWLTANMGVVIFLAVLVGGVVLALGAISSACAAALTGSTLRLSRGEPDTIGAAFGSLWTYVGRFLGLWLLLSAVGLLIGAAVAAAIAGGIASAPRGGMSWVGPLVAVLFSAPLFILLLLGSLIASIIVPLAQRAMVDQDLGPLSGLLEAWRLARRRIGRSLMLWLVAVVMGIVAAIIAGIAFFVFALVVAAVGIPLWFIAGPTAPFWTGLGVLALIGIILAIGFGGLSNSVFWGYWTLAYLDLVNDPSRSSANPTPGGASP